MTQDPKPAAVYNSRSKLQQSSCVLRKTAVNASFDADTAASNYCRPSSTVMTAVVRAGRKVTPTQPVKPTLRATTAKPVDVKSVVQVVSVQPVPRAKSVVRSFGSSQLPRAKIGDQYRLVAALFARDPFV